MKIYIAHSRDFDYQNELYLPLKNSDIFSEYEFILPHDGDNYKHDREFYKNVDLVIAEVSFPSTGLGIELGFLYDDNKPIYCIHKDNMKISSSINAITKNIYEYKNNEKMLIIINDIIKRYHM
jgi:nucleoside 2-deoxyribosyltransferase